MAQKAYNSSLKSFAGYYPTREVYESGLIGSSFKEPAVVDQRALKGASTLSPQCLLYGGTHQSACEFQDYCNHLYYIDDRCCCASSWKRMTGLVIPTSI